MKRIAVLCLCFLCGGALPGCGRDADSQAAREKTVQYGHYEYTRKDGTAAEIDLTAQTVCFVNHDYTGCHQFRFLHNYSDLNAVAQDEGRKLTEDEVRELKEEADAFDFTQYENTPMKYEVSEWTGNFLNIYPLTADGTRVSGLEFTYNEDHTISCEDGYYVCKGEAHSAE